MPFAPGTTITIGGILCDDEDAWEEVTSSGPKSYRQILCAWGDRTSLLNFAVGLVGPGTLFTPLTYPDNPVLHVTGAKTKGVGVKSVGANGMVAYQWARIVFEFGPPIAASFGSQSGLQGIELDFDIDVLTIPKGGLEFLDGVTVPVPFNIPIATARVSIPKTYFSIPSQTYFGLLGTISSDSFYGAAEKKAMFLGARARQRFLLTGGSVYDCVETTKVRGTSDNVPHFNQGWNPFTKSIMTYGDPQPFEQVTYEFLNRAPNIFGN